MKILMAGSVLREGWGGGEPEQARQLAKGMERLGVSVSFSTSQRTLSELVSMAAFPGDSDPVNIHHYSVALRREKPDAVLAFYDYDSSIVVACEHAGIPVLVCVHIHWPVCPIGVLYVDGQGICTGPKLGKCLKHMQQGVPSARLQVPVRSLPLPLGFQIYVKFLSRHRTLDRADGIIVPSEEMKHLLETKGFRNVHSIPNGIQAAEFQTSQLSDNRKIILFAAGASTERKGYAHFSEVARRLGPKFPLFQFVATNSKTDDWVRGTPLLTRSQYVGLLERTAIVVIPSIWNEPFGMVALEAMAASAPVVAYAAGALGEIVVDRSTGRLVPRGDIDGLTTAIEDLLNSDLEPSKIWRERKETNGDRIRRGRYGSTLHSTASCNHFP